MGPRDAVDVLAQACRGLDYAHRNGVVHRDVKPANLLRNTEGVVKLADFGIAKAAEQSDITKVGSVLGTAAYLSPEQARGEPAGPKSDLYALGVVAYQLMADRLPYEAASLTDLARLQEAGAPERLSEVARDVPDALATAVARALARDPERRYADAAEMEDALRDGLAGVAHTEDLDATRALPPTDATRALGATRTGTGTSAVPPARRRLQPIAEEPRRTPPPRRATSAPPQRGGGAGKWIALVAVLLIIVAGVVIYENAGGSGNKSVQLKSNPGGKVDEAIPSFKDLVDDNTQ
jgi:serine/threonine-protein kinase